MNDLLTRVKCPMGCSNSLFTETTKIIKKSSNSLLLESGKESKSVIKVYTCQCCGNTFEMKQNSGKNIL